MKLAHMVWKQRVLQHSDIKRSSVFLLCVSLSCFGKARQMESVNSEYFTAHKLLLLDKTHNRHPVHFCGINGDF